MMPETHAEMIEACDRQRKQFAEATTNGTECCGLVATDSGSCPLSPCRDCVLIGEARKLLHEVGNEHWTDASKDWFSAD